MLHFILWYLLISFVGLAALPLAYRLLPALADCGYAFSRSLGLLVWGFAFWLLASLGILHNDPGGLLFSLGIVIALGVWAGRGLTAGELRGWWREQRGLVLTVELLFLAAFAGWALVRAANPEAFGTEKPMELAFINAILRSPTFPPHDPWLAGYAISYYYFGYVLVAIMAKLTGTPGAVAFNLGVSLVFALSAAGAYGLVYNLLAAHKNTNALTRPESTARQLDAGRPALFLPLLGPLFVLFVSNVEGFLHMLHGAGLFWRQDASGALVSPFWQWLDILDLNQAPTPPFSWAPTGFWWWWRASRVVRDYDLAGRAKEIIDEFPAFSYLLSDLHPHVLAMPFAFLAIALALNLFMGSSVDGAGLRVSLRPRTLFWAGVLAAALGLALVVASVPEVSLRLALLGLVMLAAGAYALLRTWPLPASASPGDSAETWDEINFSLSIRPAGFILAAVVLGGLAFLNTWDFPVYVALFSAAYGFRRLKVEDLAGQRSVPGEVAAFVRPFFQMAFALGIAGILVYLPFYLGFSSQAGGPVPNLVYPTRGAQLWVMFGTLLLPILAFLVYSLGRKEARGRLLLGFSTALGVFLVLWALDLLLGVLALRVPFVGNLLLDNLGAASAAALFQGALTRRFTNLGWVTLVGVIGLALALIFAALRQGRGERGALEAAPGEKGSLPLASIPSPLILSSSLFALLLILLGALVVLGPEFFYLRDQFGSRMNTIFKFYFQGWLLWAVAAAFGAAVLLKELRGIKALLYRLGLVAVVLVGLVYPVFGLWSKTNGFNPGQWTLDSSAYYRSQAPDDMAAIDWLKTAPYGVVAEAVPANGGQYSGYARAATLSGLPDVLGWVGHEGQWRGGYTEVGSRQSDLERLYCGRDWSEAAPILEQYHVRYVIVGSLERAAYPPGGACPTGLNQAKFDRFLKPVFQQGDVTIYETPGFSDQE